MKRHLSALFVMSLCAAPPAFAEEEAAPGQIVVKVGTVAPEGTPWSELMKRIKNRFKKDSNDKIKMKLYFGGRLGGEKEMVRETREGRLQLFGGSVSAIATIVPELYVLEAPFLFESDEEADFVLDNFAKPHVEGLLASKGFVFFQFSENGWHGIALKDRCVKSLADLKGKKVRSQEATIHLDTFNALGANPVPMAVPEVLPALQGGIVDGFSNTPLFAFATSWYQGVKFYTVTDHIYQPAAIIYSKKWFDQQPKEMQKILLDGAAGDTEFGRKGVRGIRDGLLDNFTKSKVEVCKVTPELRKEMAAATSKIFGQYQKKASKEGKPLFDAILKGKAEYKKKKG